jgi:hypothetical protein
MMIGLRQMDFICLEEVWLRARMRRRGEDPAAFGASGAARHSFPKNADGILGHVDDPGTIQNDRRWQRRPKQGIACCKRIKHADMGDGARGAGEGEPYLGYIVLKTSAEKCRRLACISSAGWFTRNAGGV